MELRLHPHDWSRPRPDWRAAVVAGLVAGAVLMVLDMAWSVFVTGDSPWSSSYRVAAIVMGRDVLQATAEFDSLIVGVALVTHYALGVVFALLLATLVAGFHYDRSPGMTELIGALFGAFIYLVNFHGLAQFFPWFAEWRSWAALIAHLVFGMTAATLYWQFARHEES